VPLIYESAPTARAKTANRSDRKMGNKPAVPFFGDELRLSLKAVIRYFRYHTV
jgi:hypothetical protein